MAAYDVLLALRPVVTVLELTGAHFFLSGQSRPRFTASDALRWTSNW
jgi:hypothetical protein